MTCSNSADSKTITKESLFAYAGWWAQIPGFRRFVPMPSDLSYALESCGDSMSEEIGSPPGALPLHDGHEKADTVRSCVGGSDPGPLSLSARPK
ncbi:hypothetical protein THAOC_13060, partial [Thalassiosira oceanica]